MTDPVVLFASIIHAPCELLPVESEYESRVTERREERGRPGTCPNMPAQRRRDL